MKIYNEPVRAGGARATTAAPAGEGLAAFIMGGGEGSLALNVESRDGVERLIVDTPAGGASLSAAVLD